MINFGLGVLVGIVISYLFGLVLLKQEQSEYRLTQESADELAKAIFDWSKEPGYELEVSEWKSKLTTNGYRYEILIGKPVAIKEH